MQRSLPAGVAAGSEDLMPQKTGLTRPVAHTIAQRDGRSDEEVVFFAGAGLLMGVAAVALRVVDIVVAWPELVGSRRVRSGRRRH